MPNKIKIAIIIGMLMVATALSVTAQTINCCCDPTTKTGSFLTETECKAKNFIFTMSTVIGQSCNELCEAKRICGNGICQQGETAENCPADCAVLAKCGMPGYKPKITELAASPVKTERAIQIRYNLPCPAESIKITRCEGQNCNEIATTTAGFYKDEGELKFNTDYVYKIIANYATGASEQESTAANLGDIECWKQTNEKFCISNYYYAQYKDYLTIFGYGTTTAKTFFNVFEKAISQNFGERLNKAWSCTNNRLSEAIPRVSCAQNEHCVSDEKGARCAKPEECGTGFDPFGLFATRQSCEGVLAKKYCFFDKSKTTADKCYNCSPKMNCYDYKTRGACESDNCGAGDCQWNTLFEGMGACIDKKQSNCENCDKAGILGNANAISRVWDACSDEKSNALSNALYPCFFDIDEKTSKDCGEASCLSYNEKQCSAPAGGIKLNADNTLAIKSNDQCGIQKCEYGQTGCTKNADGNAEKDCSYENKTCE